MSSIDRLNVAVAASLSLIRTRIKEIESDLLSAKDAVRECVGGNGKCM